MHEYTVAVFRHTRRGHQIPLQIVVSHHVVAWHWTQDLWRRSQCIFFFFFFFPSELGMEPRALLLLGKHSTTELNPQPGASALNHGAISPVQQWTLLTTKSSHHMFLLLLLLLLLLFLDRASLCSPCWPGVQHVYQAGLELTEISRSLQSAGIRGLCYHMRL